MIVQALRRIVQVSALLLVFGIATLSLYAHYRSARVVDDEVLMSGLQRELVCQAVHPYIDGMSNPEKFLDGNKGTLWSMRLLGVSVSDPLAAAEAVAASKHVHWPLIISIIIPVVATLVLGKVFCSWICPGYLLFELSGKLRGLLKLAEIRPAEIRFSHRNKYIFLVVGLGLAALVGAPLFALIYPPAVISRAVHAWVFGTELAGMLILLAAMVGFELFVSPRWWCRTICPGGALYGLLGKLRLVKVQLAQTDCTGCQACVPVCEAGINPITESTHIECDNCGVCINHCEPRALYYTLGLPGGRRRGQDRNQPLAANRSFLILICMLVPFLWVEQAGAHHVLGLPHYSYKENYPQRPTLEYPASSGPYDILLTSYPGDPVPGEPANLAFYIKNRQSGTVYQDPVTVQVLQTSTFGDNEVIVQPTQYQPFDNQHKFQCTFPMDAEYIVELSVMVEGKLEVIPFVIIAGSPNAAASIIITGGVLGLLSFVVIRAVQVKRKRRARAHVPVSLDVCPVGGT